VNPGLLRGLTLWASSSALLIKGFSSTGIIMGLAMPHMEDGQPFSSWWGLDLSIDWMGGYSFVLQSSMW
jgi:hypothetical protein